MKTRSPTAIACLWDRSWSFLRHNREPSDDSSVLMPRLTDGEGRGTVVLTLREAALTPGPMRVKEVMPMSSHSSMGITVEAARR